jgi:hypothetical protein
MPVMSRLLVGVATVAAVIGVADRAHAQATPGQRKLAPAEPADPSDTWDKKVALGLEAGPGGVLTSYDVADSPNALLFYTALRGTYALSPHWSGGLALRQWWLPNSNHATQYSLIARYEPPEYKYGRVFVDVAAGAASTSYAWGFGFDVGGGVEWDIPDAAGLALGAFLRYNQVLNPDRRTSDDGRAWAVGLAMSYHFGRAAAAAKSGDGPRRSSPPTGGGGYKIGVPDSDRDGVGDDQDVCRNVPQGKHPDPFKPGCPENDEDGDEVPDVDDACPVSVPGPNPDPKRPGCPLVDTDKDGIADPDDACPLKPGPATADPAHYGCPTGEKKKAAEEAAPPPGETESPNAPSTVKKRNKMK